MRRDVGFFVEAPVEQVYNAYLQAAKNKPFERTCEEKPFHTISFGVNYSFKYNMNGGSCNIHFMPKGNGTAVNIRFSIAQLVGARYEQYAQDLNRAMLAFLPVAIRPAEYNMDDFERPENQVTPATLRANTQPVTPVMPAAPVAATATAFCSNCGNALEKNARFCAQCGTAVAVPEVKVCPNCKAQASAGAAFCIQCGTRL